jgi:acyl-ACP thioesterase
MVYNKLYRKGSTTRRKNKMNINFKWSVGNVVKVPLFGQELVETTILERRFKEDKDEAVIEYKTDLFIEGSIYTQEDIEKFNMATTETNEEVWIITANGVALDKYGWFEEESECIELCHTFNKDWGTRTVGFRPLKVEKNENLIKMK